MAVGPPAFLLAGVAVAAGPVKPASARIYRN